MEQTPNKFDGDLDVELNDKTATLLVDLIDLFERKKVEPKEAIHVMSDLILILEGPAFRMAE